MYAVHTRLETIEYAVTISNAVLRNLLEHWALNYVIFHIRLIQRRLTIVHV